MSVDVLIIGGGLAGINAAWECQKSGKSVMVLEARDRVGGRTLTETHDYNGKQSHFDLGAHFIGHEVFQSTIWSLVKELGLQTFPQWDGPDEPPFTPGSGNPYWSGQGANLQSYGGNNIEAYIGNTIPPESAGQTYMEYLDQLSQEVPLEAPDRTPNAKTYDAMSVWDWVNEVDLPGFGPAPDTFKGLTRMLCRVGFSAEPENISMLWMLFYIASSGGLARFQGLRWPVPGAQGYRLVEGAQSIAETIAGKLTAADANAIQLGQVVKSVVDNDSTVTVTTEAGKTYEAKRVLIAMAPVLCNEISFTPPLSDDRIAAGENMSNSSMIMTYVTFSEAFWREDKTTYTKGTVNGVPTDNISRFGLSGDALLVDGPVVWIMDNTSYEGQPALFAFIVGEEARKLAPKSKADRQAAVLKVMTDLFGSKVGSSNPVYYEKDWNLEPFSKGCPASHFKPGAFLKYGNSVLLSGLGPKPHGHVYFASTEASAVSNGYMDGAVWAGQQVAFDIRRSLGEKVPVLTAPIARGYDMKWCVQTVLKAIEAQNPMMELPAMAPDVTFYGPGGNVLPTGPYIGAEGTVGFYVLLGTYFTITSLTVDTVSVDVRANTAYATWRASGIVNSNGNPFHDVLGTMLFEFTLPGISEVLVKKEWLFMDSALMDAMVIAPPAQPDEETPAETAKLEQVATEAVTKLLSGEQHSRSDFLIYGPGGKALPHGPYFGADGQFEFINNVLALKVKVNRIISQYMDAPSLTYYLTQEMTGISLSGNTFTQPVVAKVQFANDPGEAKIESVTISTHGLALD